jgi:uncharacterized protein (TIGR03083 family)
MPRQDASVPPNRPPLRPDLDGCGLAGGDPDDVAALVSAAWAGIIEIAGSATLQAPSRLEEWSTRDVLIHLGSWDEHRSYARLIEDARRGRVHEVDDNNARNALVIASHHDAGRDEIVAALERARDRALEFLAGEDAEDVGRIWTESVLGPLPVTTVIVASTFELATHALDVSPACDVPAGLLDAGVAALADLAGALAARRDLRATVAVITPHGGWATAADEQNWATMRLPTGSRARVLGWPAVEGAAADMIDAAAGRRLAAQLVLTRRLRLYDLAGLLRFSSALEVVPGLPGGSAVQAASQALTQTGRLISRIGRLFRS